jgi:hypothetical protein
MKNGIKKRENEENMVTLPWMRKIKMKARGLRKVFGDKE